MLATQRIIIKTVCWQMNVVEKCRSQRQTTSFLRFLAIISNLKLETVRKRVLCTCALWVVLMKHLSLQCKSWLCFGCVKLFLTIRLFSDLQMSFYWRWLLAVSLTELITHPRQEEFGGRGCICVFMCACSGWELQEQRVIGYWCDYSVVFAQKWCFIRAPKVSMFSRFAIIHLQHLLCGTNSISVWVGGVGWN